MGLSAINTLCGSRVAVFGIGGVGGYVTEVLARSGIGEIDLFDDDCVGLTNLNRQIYALHSTLGRPKVDVAEERIRDINPCCIVHKHQMFYLPQNADSIDLSQYDYVVDCIDTVSAKLELIRRCHDLCVPILSCMGAANKLDPTAFRITDISKTKMDPIAKIIRKKLRKLHIDRLKVVYSEEEPLRPIEEASPCDPADDASPRPDTDKGTGRRSIPASNAYVPAAAGIIAGGEVVNDLVKRSHTLRLTHSDTATAEAARQAAQKAAAHMEKYQATLRATEESADRNGADNKPQSI